MTRQQPLKQEVPAVEQPAEEGAHLLPPANTAEPLGLPHSVREEVARNANRIATARSGRVSVHEIADGEFVGDRVSSRIRHGPALVRCITGTGARPSEKTGQAGSFAIDTIPEPQPQLPPPCSSQDSLDTAPSSRRTLHRSISRRRWTASTAGTTDPFRHLCRRCRPSSRSGHPGLP